MLSLLNSNSNFNMFNSMSFNMIWLIFSKSQNLLKKIRMVSWGNWTVLIISSLSCWWAPAGWAEPCCLCWGSWPHTLLRISQQQSQFELGLTWGTLQPPAGHSRAMSAIEVAVVDYHDDMYYVSICFNQFISILNDFSMIHVNVIPLISFYIYNPLISIISPNKIIQ